MCLLFWGGVTHPFFYGLSALSRGSRGVGADPSLGLSVWEAGTGYSVAVFGSGIKVCVSGGRVKSGHSLLFVRSGWTAHFR